MEEVGAESPRKITSEYYRVVDELLSRMLTRIGDHLSPKGLLHFRRLLNSSLFPGEDVFD